MSALLTVAETADRLRCSQTLVYDLLKQGRLPYVRLGQGQGGKRICEDDLVNFVAENKVIGVGKIQRASRIKLKHLQL